jgi:hypothetical protein
MLTNCPHWSGNTATTLLSPRTQPVRSRVCDKMRAGTPLARLSQSKVSQTVGELLRGVLCVQHESRRMQ